MKSKELVVFLEGRRIGLLREENDGRHVFAYDMGEDTGASLSLSMPRRARPWSGKPVEAFIDGVLPDERAMRQRIARIYDVNANNPFSLLSAIGLDCAGGVQFVPIDNIDTFERDAGLQEISEPDIRQRLMSISDNRQATWQGEDEHWSLNGAQDKIALCRLNDTWYEAQGSAPTTHIVKPGIMTLHEQAFNEYVCLKTIEQLDLPVSNSQFRIFDGLPALVSKRWDRKYVKDKDGRTQILRIHQEDLCQATAHPSAEKYQAEGGPGPIEIVRCLRDNGLDESSIALFYIALILNFLMAGSDAHARNYAITEPIGDTPQLAPLYDVASMFAYDTSRNQRKLAMSIGGEYNWERIELRHWRKLVNDAGSIDIADLEDFLTLYSKRLPGAFAEASQTALDLSKDVLYADDQTHNDRVELVNRIQNGIDKQCERVRQWFR
ncbi:type II toxin-antitoxin system HipA family toxin [Bifidobacterium aquikefiri]|uniref:type II toxin-antitoxin system HipA family toxin n=1 Tax=Bifidobacterium aquikefiri TaxID=1653207 RepID=UPI0039EA068C